MQLHTPQEIIEDIKNGKMVILMDDEDRENEGDLVMAAEHVTPEAINFMATHGRGLICLTLTKERCERLKLPLMVDNNKAQFATNFTVSIEAAQGVTTGISAADRAVTVQAAVAADAKATDIVQPGHIFPLKAKDGGVLTRAGHTEAGCDLARLAGLEPAAVIVEILNEDGTMARRPDLEKFSQKHGIKLGTIADLIEYRQFNESTIRRVAECRLPTEYGEFQMFTYQDKIDGELHYALTKGDIQPENPTLVRVHLRNTLSDVLQSQRAVVRSFSLPDAMKRIQAEDGVLLILGHTEPTEEMINLVSDLEREDRGELPEGEPWKGTSRNVGVGSQILKDLNVQKMRLLSSKKPYNVTGFGLEIVEFVDE